MVASSAGATRGRPVVPSISGWAKAAPAGHGPRHRCRMACLWPAAVAGLQIDLEIQADELAREEQVSEIDDGAVAIAGDAAQLRDRRGFVQPQPACNFDIGFADGEGLLNLAQVGVVCRQTFEHGSVTRGLLLQL